MSQFVPSSGNSRQRNSRLFSLRLSLLPRSLALALILLGFANSTALAQNSEKIPKNVSEIANAAQPIHAVWIESQSAELRSRKNCEMLINQLRECNVDDVFVEVRSMGDAYYRTSLSPTAMGLTVEFQDPLGSLIELAKRPGARPLRVHAVLDLFHVYNDNFPLDAPKDHLINLHPEWLGHDNLGNTRDKDRNTYLDPDVPAVQDYLTSVVAELVGHYSLDGIHFANFRYPGNDMEWGYNSMAIQQFQIDTGVMTEKPAKDSNDWIRWRTSQLTRLLEKLSRVAHSTSQTMIVSASAIATGPSPDVNKEPLSDWQKAMQDWPAWCKNGSVDWLVLEDYQAQDSAQKQFAQWIDYARKQKEKAKLVVAVSGEKNMDSSVLMQMRLAISREIDGVLLYSYQKPALNLTAGGDFLGLLGKTVFSPDYVLPSYVHEAILAEIPTALATPEHVEVSTPTDLPRPVALEKLNPPAPVFSGPIEPQMEQADAARALLGDDASGQRGSTVKEPENAKDIPPIPEADFVGSGWLKVRLTNGQSFIAQKLESDSDTTVFQVRNRGAKLTLKNSQIVESSPVAPGK